MFIVGLSELKHTFMSTTPGLITNLLRSSMCHSYFSFACSRAILSMCLITPSLIMMTAIIGCNSVSTTTLLENIPKYSILKLTFHFEEFKTFK